jgi:hypothetical protein
MSSPGPLHVRKRGLSTQEGIRWNPPWRFWNIASVSFLSAPDRSNLSDLSRGRDVLPDIPS